MFGFLIGIVVGFAMAWGSMYLWAWMFSGHFYDDLRVLKKKLF